MILVNHFLDTNISGILIPNRDAAGTTNSAASIMAQANICSGLYGRNPNFILVCSAEIPLFAVFDCVDVQVLNKTLAAGLDKRRRRDGCAGHDERFNFGFLSGE